MRMPRDWQSALTEGRLLLLSPFPPSERRPRAALSARRNSLVVSLAHWVFIAHASPGGKTEQLARSVVEDSKSLLTLNSPANRNLVGLGAVVCDADSLPIWDEGRPPGKHSYTLPETAS